MADGRVCDVQGSLWVQHLVLKRGRCQRQGGGLCGAVGHGRVVGAGLAGTSCSAATQ